MPQAQSAINTGSTGPRCAGVDHVGLTVPSLEDAIALFTGSLGGQVADRIEPFTDDGTWFTDELGLDARARIPRMALVRCGSGVNFELFEHHTPEQRTALLRISDWGEYQVAFSVDDLTAGVAALRGAGVGVLGQVKAGRGPKAGPETDRSFFLTPWGVPMEWVFHPLGRACEGETPSRPWNPTHPER